MSDVTTQHALYKARLPEWVLVDDVCAGEAAVKAKGTTYLPLPNPLDETPESKKRYEQYLFRAVFYEATGNTLDGLTGATFNKDPVLKLPDELSYLERDADGCNVSIYQQSQAVIGGQLKHGRAGLLVDYPTVEGVLTVAEQQAQKIRAQIIHFDAKQVVNWRTAKIGSKHMLSLVVISECVEEDDPTGFAPIQIDQYRVLRLENGIYKVEIWRKVKAAESLQDSWQIVSEAYPRDGFGKQWNEIPFTFVGSINNDANTDRAPLLRLACINLSHYRNSADFEQSAFIVGQPQPWMSGIDENTRTFYSKPENKVHIGSLNALMLPANATFAFAQVQENTMVEKAMQRKEEQMVALGARLIQKGTVAKTATESAGDQSVQHSILSLCVVNLSEAYNLCLQWVARYMKVVPKDGELTYSVNQDFVESSVDPQLLQIVVTAWQQGLIPETDAWEFFRKRSIINPEKTDDDIRGELDSGMLGNKPSPTGA